MYLILFALYKKKNGPFSIELLRDYFIECSRVYELVTMANLYTKGGFIFQTLVEKTFDG